MGSINKGKPKNDLLGLKQGPEDGVFDIICVKKA